MATSLEERLGGRWVGEGEVLGRGPLRWLRPREAFTISSDFERIAESLWRVRDRLDFARGGAIDRVMYLERIGDGRYHATADDMPLGADISVSDEGYRYTPYYSWTRLRGRRWFVRVREQGRFLADGSIEGEILIRWRGLPIARNRLMLRHAGGGTSSQGA